MRDTLKPCPYIVFVCSLFLFICRHAKKSYIVWESSLMVVHKHPLSIEVLSHDEIASLHINYSMQKIPQKSVAFYLRLEQFINLWTMHTFKHLWTMSMINDILLNYRMCFPWCCLPSLVLHFSHQWGLSSYEDLHFLDY